MKKLITFTSPLFVRGKEVNTRAGVIVTWASVGPSEVTDVFMVTIQLMRLRWNMRKLHEHRSQVAASGSVINY